MPPFQHFTTKAREAIRRAHEIAIERGQNHVSPIHLLTALIVQEESMVISVLDRLDVDIDRNMHKMIKVDNKLKKLVASTSHCCLLVVVIVEVVVNIILLIYYIT